MAVSTILLSTILFQNAGAVQVKTYKIYKWDENSFVPVPGHLVDLSVGADGAVWGLNSNEFTDNIYKWDGSKFVPVPGNFKDISVGNKDNVWGPWWS